MCGIVLSIGPEADPAIFRRMLALLAPRRNRGDEAPLPG